MFQDCGLKGPHLGLGKTLEPQLEKRYNDQKAELTFLIDLMFCCATNALVDAFWLFASQKMVSS